MSAMLRTIDTKTADLVTDDSGKFTGVASVYGNIDSAGDIVAPGAFRETLRAKGNTRVLLWQHDSAAPIGLGVLKDSVDGLRIEGTLALDIEKGREAHALLKRGIVSGLSIGYLTTSDYFDRKRGARVITEADLWEVSVVTFPANDRARVSSAKHAAALERLNALLVDVRTEHVGLKLARLKRDLADVIAHEPAPSALPERVANWRRRDI